MTTGRHESRSSVGTLCQVLQRTIVYMMIVFIVFGNNALGIQKDKDVSKTREKRSLGSRQVRQTNDQLMNILQEYDTNNIDVSLLRYTPTTPSPEDVNCYVEVPVTRRVGGRCVRLGSRTWGCQAGIFLAFSTECQNEATNQPGTQTNVLPQRTTQATNPTRAPFNRRRRT